MTEDFGNLRRPWAWGSRKTFISRRSSQISIHCVQSTMA